MKAKLLPKFVQHGLRLGIGWIVGILIYFIGLLFSPYQGFEAIICQPFLAAVFSAAFVLFSWLVMFGLNHIGVEQPKGIRALSLNVFLLLVGLGLLFLSQPLGLTVDLIEPGTNTVFVGPHPAAIIAGYFLIIFSIVNWPKIVSFD